ncbi:hypothetical protein LPAF129_15830 [Ligilactobacillus pabuli]|uniref:Uncharacterized protein n=1 Tax=Ligilactobacillus pabuli TaxID=2886039 RepID=A0ABQ5JIL0_9LACO|nr:hypothetical protein [Ligilactobacillus pabuli]GKS81897.1 hypothetical protein LPAF129_15830 [Ligilactobacillus pabuli]HIW89076.1 hypothetical protein [Candidatus Ligilactobacillus excrementipullorum]
MVRDKIIDQFKIDKYTVFCLENDSHVLKLSYKKCRIKDVEYTPVSVMDAPNAIAIVGDVNNLIGQFVEYV